MIFLTRNFEDKWYAHLADTFGNDDPNRGTDAPHMSRGINCFDSNEKYLVPRIMIIWLTKKTITCILLELR